MPTVEEIEKIRDKAEAELKAIDPRATVRGTILSGVGDYFAIVAIVPEELVAELMKNGWEKYRGLIIHEGKWCQHMMKRSERFV